MNVIVIGGANSSAMASQSQPINNAMAPTADCSYNSLLDFLIKI